MLNGVMPYFNAAEYIALGGRAIIGRKDRGIDATNPKSMEGKKIGYLRGSTKTSTCAHGLKRTISTLPSNTD